jgi:hypothetical protein
MVADQRQNVRWLLDGRVRVKTQNGRWHVLRAYLDDLSLGGFRMYAKDELNVGDNLMFRVRTPSLMHSFRGIGKVRSVIETKKWATPYYSMGVEFMFVDKDKVGALIEKKKHGGDMRGLLYQEAQRDLSTILKLTPILLLVTWFIFRSLGRIETDSRRDQLYSQELRKGVIHYLYHS